MSSTQKAIAFENLSSGRRAQVEVIENFKGSSLKTIGASGDGCGLTISIGEARIFFLDNSGNGHVMAYPVGKSTEEILLVLRRLKAT